MLLVLLGQSRTGAEMLPDALVLLPVSEHAVIVEKKTQTLYVYEARADGIRLKSQYPCSTGAVVGPKAKAGDKKTPEGVYFLKDEYEDRYLTPVYGKKAFPSDYPNFFDLRQGRQGSAIWIHGTDKALKPMDSNGCVAMENHNILALAEHIRLDATPLIIVQQMGMADPGRLAGKRERVLALIRDWGQALITGSYHDYLSFYSDTYLPDIFWWETWLKFRKQGRGRKTPLSVDFDQTGLYAHGDMVVAIMDMTVSTGKETAHLGRRQLFIRQVGDGYAIIGDLFQKKTKTYLTGEAPLVAAARKMIRDDATDKVVVETVEQWLAAWSAKEMAEYAGFYHKDFYSDGLGKTAWVKRKKRLARRYDYINVTGSDYRVVRLKDGYKVSFFQNYDSSGFSTTGMKQLKLVKKGGLWKIFRENWKGK
jgi:murein L,D-transpeptidase YafK